MNRGAIKTIRGYPLDQVVSAIQKAIRRNNFKVAGYFALELYLSGYREYVWKRLRVIAAEDVYGCVTHEIEALYDSWKKTSKQYPQSLDAECKIFVAKAVCILAEAKKSRSANHLTALVYRKKVIISDAEIDKYLNDPAILKDPMPMPEEAIDMHTSEGRHRGERKGAGDDAWYKREHLALKPRKKDVFLDKESEKFLKIGGKK